MTGRGSCVTAGMEMRCAFPGQTDPEHTFAPEVHCQSSGSQNHASATDAYVQVVLRMAHATVTYGCEYLGSCRRLAVTPLTDRCYCTLLGALHFNLGGAITGPAATGKTETIKDVARAVAVQFVLVSGSPEVDCCSMSRLCKGLASSGAWCGSAAYSVVPVLPVVLGIGNLIARLCKCSPGTPLRCRKPVGCACRACIDDIHRMNVEVLSIVAHQVATLLGARAARLATVEIEGATLALKPTFGLFVTMNPWLSGRALLPDNLQALLRPVATNAPDSKLITETVLCSAGAACHRSQSVSAALRMSILVCVNIARATYTHRSVPACRLFNRARTCKKAGRHL